MSQLLLHDSGRAGKLSWAIQVLESGDVGGMVISPWESPPWSGPRRPAASDLANQVVAAGGQVFFDPESHGAFLRGTDKRSIYDQWALWPDSTGPTRVPKGLHSHVERVAEIQLSLGVPLLAPTICLDAPDGSDADLVAEVFTHMRSAAQGQPWIASLVGVPTFWSSGLELDALVGRIATLKPAGVMLSVLRATSNYPWIDLTPEEVAGVCRTTLSLSQRTQVFVGRSDFAGLPAIAAGASMIGTGWDLRQRVLSADLFRDASGIRRGSERVSHRGLFASLKRQEAERLRAADHNLSRQLVPNDLPLGFNSQWRHHLSVMSALVGKLSARRSTGARVKWLRSSYASAAASFAQVKHLARPLEATDVQWISPIAAGLEMFAAAEGFLR